MFYLPIQTLRFGNKRSPIIQINLPGVAFSRDEPLEIHPQLCGLAATPGGQLSLSCKQITKYIFFLLSLS